ncbi:MAG: hypothetical protein LBH49_00865 [Puniceicoccales bacterium]|jgi:hypothetical protein|nr:hypothetical protein [Puniceicoccales bacterium]
MVDGVKFNGASDAQFGKNNAKKITNPLQADSTNFMKLVALGRVSRPVGKISTTPRTVRQLDKDTSPKAPRSLHDTLYSAEKQVNTFTPLTDRKMRTISSDELQKQLLDAPEK